MKKALIAVWGVLFAIFLVLMLNYVRTANAIDHYYNDQMRMEDLSEFGFINPCINHYNKGIVYYTKNDYLSAEKEFKKSMNSRHKIDEDRDCKIRINLALSMVKPLTPDSINSENVDEAIRILKEARGYLCENGCADMENVDFHNEEAQRLKEEIDEYIRLLEEAKENQNNQDNQDQNNSGGGSDDQNNGGGSDNNPDDKPQNGGEDSNPDNPDNGGDDPDNGNDSGNGDENQQPKDPYQDALDELQDIQNQGTGERNQSKENKESLYNYEYYGGKCW